MKHLVVALLLALTVAACSPMDILSTVGSVVGGGKAGVSVPIDAQIGRENTRTAVVVGDQVTGGSTVNNSKIDVEEAREVTINESPSFWFMVLFALGWLLPSPKDIMTSFSSGLSQLLRRKPR